MIRLCVQPDSQHSRPTTAADPTDHHPPRLIRRPRRNLDAVRIPPHYLRLVEVDAVLEQVCLALRRRPSNFSVATPHRGQRTDNGVKTVVKPPTRHGLEPLTPTLPGAGITTEQAVQAHFPAVVGVVEVVTVVRVVVKIVVRTARGFPAP